MFFLLGPGCVVQPWGHGVWRGCVACFLGPGCFVQPWGHGVGGAFFFFGSGCFTQPCFFFPAPAASRSLGAMALEELGVFFGPGCFTQPRGHGVGGAWCLLFRPRLLHAALGPWRFGGACRDAFVWSWRPLFESQAGIFHGNVFCHAKNALTAGRNFLGQERSERVLGAEKCICYAAVSAET